MTAKRRMRVAVRVGRLYEACGLGTYERDQHGNTTIARGQAFTSILTVVRMANNGARLGDLRAVVSVPR